MSKEERIKYIVQPPESKEDLMAATKHYYKEYFDPEIIFKVMRQEDFISREFGFDKFDAYFTRNKSFFKAEYLQEYLYTFNIAGAYIGAQYDSPLRAPGRESVTIHDVNWVGRELIFDLDINEYDPVRTCGCKGREMCEICWGLVQDAAKIIDETLEIEFGLKERQWVFTGGRGYHCWISDEEVFNLTQDQRSGIVNYMQLINDPLGDQRIDPIGDKATLLKSRIYLYLGKKYILNTPPAVFEEIGIKKAAYKSMLKRFHEVEASYYQNPYQAYSTAKPPRTDEDTFFTQMIKYYYPRIDYKVTIDTRRLIRMPGSVHGKTGLISEYVDDPYTYTPDKAKSVFDLE